MRGPGATSGVRGFARAGAALLLALALITRAGAGEAEKPTMADLKLTLEAVRGAWISGETPVFEAVLENIGAAPAQVPSPDARGFLTLTVTDRATGAKSVHRSGDPRRTRRPDKPRRAAAPIEEDRLAPGASLRYRIDFDDFQRRLPRAGGHDAVVGILTDALALDSPPLGFEVAPMRPLAAHSLADAAQRRLRQIRLHDGPDGAVLLLRRSAVRFPAEGGFQRVAEGLSKDAGIALAAPTRALQNYAYAAVLSDGSLRIGADVSGVVLETPLALRDAILHPFGWQIDDASAEFLLIGREGDEVRALIARGDQRKKAVSTTAIALPLSDIPDFWRVRRRAHEPSWTMVYGLGARLMRIEIAGDAVSAPEIIAEGPGPLAALALYPLAPAPPEAIAAIPSGQSNYALGAPIDAIDAVFGPFADNGKDFFALQRIDAATGEVMQSRNFGAPVLADGARIRMAISQSTGGAPYVALVLGDRLYGLGARGPADMLAEGMEGATSLTLDRFNVGYVAGWISSDGDPVFLDLN